MSNSYSQPVIRASASSPSESVSAVPDRFRSGSAPTLGRSAVPESFRSATGPVVSRPATPPEAPQVPPQSKPE